jgi:hypothetical protein
MLQNWLSSIHATLAASMEKATLDTLHAALNLKAMSSGGPIRDVLSLDDIRKLASDELAKRDRAHIQAVANSPNPDNADLEAFSTPEKALETFFAACARKDWETVCLCDSSTRPTGMRFEDSSREMAEDLRRTFGDGKILGSASVVGDNARVSIRATFPARTAELVLESGRWKIQDFSA